MARRTLLEAKWNRDSDRKCPPGNVNYSLLKGNESKFLEGPFKRSTLEAANNEKLRCFDQVFFGLSFGPALGRDIEWRAVSKIPLPLSPESAKQLEFCLDYGHI